MKTMKDFKQEHLIKEYAKLRRNNITRGAQGELF